MKGEYKDMNLMEATMLALQGKLDLKESKLQETKSHTIEEVKTAFIASQKDEPDMTTAIVLFCGEPGSDDGYIEETFLTFEEFEEYSNENDLSDDYWVRIEQGYIDEDEFESEDCYDCLLLESKNKELISESVNVNIDETTNVSVDENTTVVDTEDATVIVTEKTDEPVEEIIEEPAVEENIPTEEIEEVIIDEQPVEEIPVEAIETEEVIEDPVEEIIEEPTEEVIAEEGNYGEIYERNLGPNTPLNLDMITPERGLATPKPFI